MALLVKWVTFPGTLHWPAGGLNLGVGGISFLELLILYELWAGERLTLEEAHPRILRPGRPVSVSAIPSGPGIDIWRSCRFIGAVVRSLCCTFPPLVEIRENPEFHDLMRMDKGH